MNEFVRGVLDSKLNLRISRRRFIQGAAGLATLTVLGRRWRRCARGRQARRRAQLLRLGRRERGANVAKEFLDQDNIKLQATFQVSAADDTLTRFNTGGRGTMDLLDAEQGLPARSSKPASSSSRRSTWPHPQRRRPVPGLQERALGDPGRQDLRRAAHLGRRALRLRPGEVGRHPRQVHRLRRPQVQGELVFMDDPVRQHLAVGEVARRRRSEPPDPGAARRGDRGDAEGKPNVVTIGARFGDMADILVRGDASMGIGGWAYQMMIAKEKGVELAVGLAGRGRHLLLVRRVRDRRRRAESRQRLCLHQLHDVGRSNAAMATELGSGCTDARRPSTFSTRSTALYLRHRPRAGGGILGTQIVFPPQDDGDIVGAPAWIEAWQAFKLLGRATGRRRLDGSAGCRASRARSGVLRRGGAALRSLAPATVFYASSSRSRCCPLRPQLLAPRATTLVPDFTLDNYAKIAASPLYRDAPPPDGRDRPRHRGDHRPDRVRPRLLMRFVFERAASSSCSSSSSRCSADTSSASTPGARSSARRGS